MTFLSGISGGMAAYQGQLAQNLFNRIDSTGAGSITKSQLENAVTAAGGTAASADALYADLDPSGSGSVGESQFASTVQSLLDPQMGAPLIAAQEGAQSGASTGGFVGQLFAKLDGNGDGALTQSELEQAVTSNGGTKTSADALWAQLDPSGASSISEQQFADNLPRPGSGGTSTDGSNSAQDAMASLLQGMVPPPPAWNGDGSSSTASTGVAAADGTSALSALQDLIANGASSATGTEATGSSAQDALLSLLSRTTDGGTGASAWNGLSSYLDGAALSQWLQPQSGNSLLV